MIRLTKRAVVVYQWICRHIPVGDPLPTFAHISRETGVNETTVRLTVEYLTARGVLRVEKSTYCSAWIYYMAGRA